jgi:hypothetical protein
MILIVALVSFVFSFIVLFYVMRYLVKDELYTGDTFFHMLIIESIRNHGWKYPSSLKNVVFDMEIKPFNYLAYPPLFHYIVALLPRRFYITIVKMLNLVILSFVSSLASIFVYIITSSLPLAIVSAFVTIFNMSMIDNTIMFTSRPLGLLFYSLLAYVTLLFPSGLLSTLAITILVMLINLSHKFATQAMIFSLLPFVFIFSRFDLFLSIVFGFLLSILVSKGFYLKILREHYNWLYFYFRMHRGKSQGSLGMLARVLSRNSWYLLIVVSMAVYLISKNGSLPNNDLTVKVSFWAFMPVITALIVSTPALSFLGEGYRYVQYGAVPVGIASTLLLESPNLYIWTAFFACSFITVLVTFLELHRFKKSLHESRLLVNPGDASAYSCLRNRKLGNVLIFPHIRTLEVNYFAKLHVVHFVRGRSMTYQNVAHKYGIKHILIFKADDRARASFLELEGAFNLSRILTSPLFELYEVVSARS